MFILTPCATVKDKVTFSPVGDIAKFAPELSKNRMTLAKYSDAQYLLNQIQEGEIIMAKKVEFDNYLKSQVDIMRSCVQGSIACPFSYSGYMNPEQLISTAGMGIKQQWAIEMVISRYNLCSIYHAAAYNSLSYIFTETVNSYDKKSKSSPEFIKHLQITFKYFNEGYQPLRRLSEVYNTLELLLTPATSHIVQINKQVFMLVRDLVGFNLGYLKIEKYRIIGEFKSCKECSYAIYNHIKDIKQKLKSSNIMSKINQDFAVYLQIGELFFLCLAFYFLLEEHEDMKNKEDYGFIKKQFQEMIVQNCVVCEQFIKIQNKIQNFPNKDNLDNVMFAQSLTKKMLEEVKRKQYAYGINIHENKMTPPKIEEVIAKRISPRNLWESINSF